MTRVGADLGGTKLLLLADTGAGRTSARVATGPAFGPADLEAAIAAFAAGLPRPPSIGLAFPGLVADGAVVACDVLPAFVGWRAPRAWTVVNDCEAALLAEARHHPPSATIAVVMAGTGIGAAFLVEGRVLRGANGWAGEIGNSPVAAGPRALTLDALASGQALLERAGCSFEALESRLAGGDGAALALVAEAGSALGLGLAIVLHLLNPSALALGGGVLRLPGYREAAMANARALTLPALWSACTIAPPRDGDLAAAVGAALSASRAAGKE